MQALSPRVTKTQPNFFSVRWCLLSGLLCFSTLLTACGGGAFQTAQAASPLSISITPSSALVDAGTTQQYSVTTTSGSNNALTWMVNHVPGGDSSVGTISSTGLFTAPATPPSNPTETITAVNVADPSKSGSAAVTVVPPGTSVTVLVTPKSATVQAGLTAQFTASVKTSTNNGVTWYVNNVKGGNSTDGTVSTQGLFTAPAVVPSNPTVTIKATSIQDPTKSGSASVLIVPSGRAGTDYYVSPSGSDSNDGSSAHPWATINKADSVVGPGAIVHVSPGTYSGNIVTSAKGTASARIRYISDTQYGARLVGGSSDFVIWLAYNTYTDIVGFDFDGSVNTSEQSGIIILPSPTEGTHLLIFGNRAHNLYPSGGCNNHVGAIGEGGQSLPTYNVYDSNLIYHNNGGAGGSSSQGNSCDGLDPWGPYDVARNNVVMDQGGGWCMQVSHSASNAIITNNTLINCDRGGVILENDFTTADYVTISNNIVVNSGSNGGSSGIRAYMGACGSHNIYDNNLLYGNSPLDYEFDNGCTDTATGTQSGSNSTVFANYTGTSSGNYHLKSGSSAIDHGTTSCASTGCAPSIDLQGGARPTGPAWDIGAYEYGSQSAIWPWE